MAKYHEQLGDKIKIRDVAVVEDGAVVDHSLYLFWLVSDSVASICEVNINWLLFLQFELLWTQIYSTLPGI